MYQLIANPYQAGEYAPMIRRLSDNACIPTVADNTDYANFKKEILADEAQLQDADGNTMSATQAKTYVATLP